jgi:branched-chain amino acid transport system permease protein
VLIGAALLFVLFALPALLSGYWIKVLTSTAIFAVVALGLNLLFGRVGLVSLGQIALLAVGGWAAARLLFLTSLPFPIVLVLAGLATAAVGTVLGLPALRLSGLHLALITLMFAGLVAIVVPTTNFPNGGGGVLGNTQSSLGGFAVRRPSIAESDDAYFRYTVIVAALMFLLALAHVSSKAGRAWAAIRQSEPAALAAGVNITLYKLYAFTLASFMTGVAGGLFAGNVGRIYSYQFSGARTIDSVSLLAVVLMGGIYSLWGAVVAAALQQLLPALLNDWFGFFQRNPDFLLVLFGIGVLQVLVTAPEGIVTQFPKDLRNLGRLIARGVRRLFGGKEPP